MNGLRTLSVRILLWWTAAACLLPAAAALAGGDPLALRVMPDSVRQGGIAGLRITGTQPGKVMRLRVGGREIRVEPSNAATTRLVWIGVDLEQPPGPLELVVEERLASGWSPGGRAAILVVDAGYPVQRLSVPRSFTELDAATLARIAREKAVLDRLWESATPERYWRSAFRLPLEEPAQGTGFGLKRIINGEPRAPHTGIDFSVPAGTRVIAANAGMVALAEEHFFGGRSLVLDHGDGLYTMYFHLQDSLVKLGQQIAQGDVIGLVGSTGRSTGPHLHWGARLHGARINPDALLRLPPE